MTARIISAIKRYSAIANFRRRLFLLLLLLCALPAYSQSYVFDNSASVQAAYPWIDISTTGTTISLTDDAVSGVTNLGFTFNFGGTDFTQVRVASNGMLQFGGTSTAFGRQRSSQILRQENILLRPAVLGQVVDDS